MNRIQLVMGAILIGIAMHDFTHAHPEIGVLELLFGISTIGVVLVEKQND